MKKLLIALTLILTIAFPAQAATITGRVNQRTGASTAYSIIQKIPSGADVGVVYRLADKIIRCTTEISVVQFLYKMI